MKRMLISALVTSVMLVIGTGPVSAQDDGMKVIPVEMFTCKYKERKDADDLENFVKRWNAWMDSIGNDSYAAWTLTPYYYGPDQDFDIIWLGAGKDAVSLGEAQDKWITNPNGLNDLVNDVFTCDSHSNFASINFKAPPGGTTPATSILTFSDCSYKDGASFTALGAAMAQWADYQTNAGSTAGIWHWYPAYGGGGEKFSFKWLEAYANLADLGGDYERYGNGRGFVTNGRLLSHLIDCDSSRAYIAQSRRYVQLR